MLQEDEFSLIKPHQNLDSASETDTNFGVVLTGKHIPQLNKYYRAPDKRGI